MNPREFKYYTHGRGMYRWGKGGMSYYNIDRGEWLFAFATPRHQDLKEVTKYKMDKIILIRKLMK
jgi:hypothetical protein